MRSTETIPISEIEEIVPKETEPVEIQEITASDSNTVARRSSRIAAKIKEILGDNILGAVTVVDELIVKTAKDMKIPKSYQEAIRHEQANRWLEAMDVKVLQFQRTNTFELIPEEAHMNLLDGVWVFNSKRVTNSEATVFKARYCARGFRQLPGQDYDELFAPTIRADVIRTVLTKAAVDNDDIVQMDVSAAFLHADIDKTIYLLPPEGYRQTDEAGRRLVWRLKKAIYGLKQSPKLWYETVHKKFKVFGLRSHPTEPCLYKYGESDDTITILQHVDDFLVIGKKGETLNKVRRFLTETFRMKDLGEVSRYLGIDIRRDTAKRTITLCKRRAGTFPDECCERHTKSIAMRDNS
jgi:hypothetical protein